MTLFFSFVLIGLVYGAVYSLIATGLVVTYTTTGVFNFGHGAVAMASAYGFWQLWQGWGLNVWLSFFLMLLVIAPLFGLVIEFVLIRPLRDAPVDVNIVVTLGILLAMVGGAYIIWDPNTPRSLPYLFNGSGFSVVGEQVSYHDVIAILSLVAVGIGLRILFRRARLGIAMRAVVDNSDLLAMAGGRPIRVQQMSWALSIALAALAGMLLGPIEHLNVLNLTLLVVDGYAAAIIGRLRNLPVAITGGLVIAVGQQIAKGYLPSSGFLNQVQIVIPIGVLFLALIALPQDRLRTASFAGAVAPRVASLKSSIAGSAGVIVLAVILSSVLSTVQLRMGISTFGLAMVLLSLNLVTGYGGMVSLCQYVFVGLGCYGMAHLGHGGSLLGVLAAVVLCAAVGALVALPTLRLRGLYLALATFAFASVMEVAIFGEIFGTGGSLTVPRIKIPGIPTQSDRAFFVLSAIVFAACAVGVLALRRGPFGRKIVAANDSPAACATLGVNINFTKLAVFAIGAGLAGLGGLFVGGSPGQLTAPNDVAALVSLVVLLLARVGGINTATGAIFGALTFSVLYPELSSHFHRLASAQYLLTGLAAISVGRDPNGFGGRIAALVEQFRQIRERSRPSGPQPAAPATAPGTPAAVFISEEGDNLVGAGN